jgi:carboxyl-terminal processing protease
LIEIEFGYTSILDHYYRKVDRARVLEGARSGIEGYLRARGIAHPHVARIVPRADGRGDVPAIEQRIGVALQRYGARLDVRELVYATIRGELAALHDPYSTFFTKAELGGFTKALGGETFGGIGVEIAVDRDAKRWRIDRVFPGGPADKAGVEAGDEIVAIDDVPLDVDHEDATRARLRGKIGTTVALTIVRNGTQLAAPLRLVRAVVSPPESDARMLPGNVGYLALSAFGDRAAPEVRDGLRTLRAAGMRALVFDLRDDGGGYETQAVRVASLFIAHGPIVAVQQYGKPRVTTTAAPGADLELGIPIVVLVNGNSASGAELVAAALRERAGATLVGTKTFGKGVVQEVFPLPDGSALKVTTARYYTAAGHDIDRVGLVPDIEVEQPGDAAKGVPGRDPQLDRALASFHVPSLSAPSPSPSPAPTP